MFRALNVAVLRTLNVVLSRTFKRCFSSADVFVSMSLNPFFTFPDIFYCLRSLCLVWDSIFTVLHILRSRSKKNLCDFKVVLRCLLEQKIAQLSLMLKSPGLKKNAPTKRRITLNYLVEKI